MKRSTIDSIQKEQIALLVKQDILIESLKAKVKNLEFENKQLRSARVIK